MSIDFISYIPYNKDIKKNKNKGDKKHVEHYLQNNKIR